MSLVRDDRCTVVNEAVKVTDGLVSFGEGAIVLNRGGPRNGGEGGAQ